MFGRRKKVEKIPLEKKFASIAFFTCIPLAWVGGAFFVSVLISSLMNRDTSLLRWVLFLHGALVAWFVFTSEKFPRLQTAIHELKHAVLAFFAGHKITDFIIGEDRGHVSYELYRTKIRFEPFIILGPYFFPLLSLPILLVSLFVPQGWQLLCVYLFGLAFSADITTAFRELHPNQTDLRRVFGGVIATRSFIYGMHLLWSSICLVWVGEGERGFLYAGYLFVKVLHVLINSSAVTVICSW